MSCQAVLGTGIPLWLRLLGPAVGRGPSPCPCWTRLLSFARQPTGEDGEARAGDAPAAAGEEVSAGQPLQNGLHAEGQGGEGVPGPPRKDLPPGKAAAGAIPSKAPSPAPGPAAAAPKPAETSCPEAPKAAKPSCPEKTPKDPRPGGSPPAPATAPSKGPQRCSKVPAKEGHAPKETGPESPKKEKGAPPSHEQPPAKARAKREPAPVRKEPEKMKKDVGGGKKEPREIKKPGKTTNKPEGLKEEQGGIPEKSEDVVKEMEKAKEEPGESKEAPGESKEALGESKETGESTAKDQDQVTCLQPGRAVPQCLWGADAIFWFPAAPPVPVGSAGGWGGGQRRGRGSAWGCRSPWGTYSLSSAVLCQFPSLLPAVSERRLVRSGEGLARPAGRIHAG